MEETADQARILYGKIKYVLLKQWDPIGIQAMQEAEDEYDGYVPTLYSMLVSCKPANEVFDHLLWLETEHMGLRADKQRTQSIAEKLVDLTAGR